MGARKIKTTFFFRTDQGGWSESYVNMLASDLAGASVDALAFADKRLAICGLGVAINAIRVSEQDTVPKRSKLVSNNPAGTGFTEKTATPALTGLTDPVEDSGDQLQTALLVTCQDSAATRKLIWLGGIPDALIRDNPPGPSTITRPSWSPRWDIFRAELQGGRWGFVRRTRGNALTTPKLIDTWVNESGPGSRIGAQFTGANPGYVPGSGKVQIRRATLFNTAQPGPRGTWTVHSVATVGPDTVVYLRGTELVDINNIDGAGEIAGIDYEAQAIVAAEIVRQTSHRRGRPFGLYRGRSKRAA